jgi:hypothetical protein
MLPVFAAAAVAAAAPALPRLRLQILLRAGLWKQPRVPDASQV